VIKMISFICSSKYPKQVMKSSILCLFATITKGHVVAQLVETLCYKLEGRGFNSQ
jgi:hypothetical protein